MSLHPNITHAWIEWVIEDGEHKTELVIETNLETRPDASGFDEAHSTRWSKQRLLRLRTAAMSVCE